MNMFIADIAILMGLAPGAGLIESTTKVAKTKSTKTT